MFVLLNGAVPTLTQLRDVIEGKIPDTLVVDDFSDYEGNLQFDPMYIVYGEDRLIFSGYNAIWELMEFDVKNDKAQSSIIAELFEWIEDEFKWNNVDSMEYALNWHGKDEVAKWIDKVGSIEIDENPPSVTDIINDVFDNFDASKDGIRDELLRRIGENG